MRVLVASVAVCLSVAAAAAVGTLGGLQATSILLASAMRTSDSGVLGGIVEDAAGRPMPGVTVDLLVNGRTIATATTDARGEFTFEDVPHGLCEVRATYAGLAPVFVRAAVGELPTPPLRLSLGVQVHAETSAVAAAPPPPPSPGAITSRVGGAIAPRARHVAGAGGNFKAASLAQDFNTATYDRIEDNRFRLVSEAPLSTFSADVDTASYANVRRFLNDGSLPPPDAVRIEELINYFRFPYGNPKGDHPFAITTEVAPCPWNPRHRLALIGLQARKPAQEHTAPRNLVFLLDVSGSMMPPDRLPLVKSAMRMLTDTLTAQDRVAIVVYAGASGRVLPSTPGDRKEDIHQAIAALEAGGSTNGAAGIQLAYDTAAASFIKGGINRVILATDGDFNVGVTSQGELIRLIERQRERGIFLSVLGVGTDNLKDSTMEKLADRGNGNYSYLDSLHEARKVLVAEAGATLVTVARDVKIQVEFNPRAVGAYRLVGYENRLLNAEDFNDDRKDAGEVGAGHTVTVLYELIPPGEPIGGVRVDPLKYQEAPRPRAGATGELMTVKLRYKDPDGETSRLMSVAVRDRSGELTASLGFAAAVAEFGMLLRDSEFKGAASWASAQALARRFQGDDPDGHRSEFVRLVDLGAALAGQKAPLEQTRR